MFGKLNTPTAETVWRFNYFAKKFPLKASDIFEEPAKEETVVPEEWLGKVQTQAPNIYRGGPSNQGNVGSGRNYDHLKPYQFRKNDTANTASDPKSQNAVGTHTSSGTNRHWTEASLGNHFGFPNTGDIYDEEGAWAEYYAQENARQAQLRDKDKPTGAGATGPVTSGYIANNSSAANSRAKWGYDPKSPVTHVPPSTVPPLTTVNRDPNVVLLNGDDESTSGEDALARVREDVTTEEEVGAYHLGKPQHLPSQSLDGNDSESNSNDLQPFTEGLYEAILEEHGKDVADTWWSIDQTMHILCGADEHLMSLSCDMYELMDDDTKIEFCREMLSRMPAQLRTEIETNGL